MIVKKLSKYKTLVFDCDGVIFNSNTLKTDAFRKVALTFGKAEAEALVDYHIQNGGISRREKFKFFIEKIIKDHPLRSNNNGNMEKLLSEFSEYISIRFNQCELAEGIPALRKLTSNTKWIVVSASEQAELRNIFSQRNISKYYDGIFGGPTPKDMILYRKVEERTIELPAVYIGDSIADFVASKKNGIDFIFVYGWSDLRNWKTFISKNQICAVEKLSDLFKLI